MGTLQTIGRHLVLAIEPLKHAMESPDNFIQFLYRMGWSVSDLPPAYSDLVTKTEEALTELELLTADPTIEKALSVIRKVKNVFDAIDAVTEAPPGIPVVEEFLSEFRERLFELLLTDYLATEQPGLYNFFQMIGVLEKVHYASKPGRPSFVRMQIHWDKFPETIIHPENLPETVYGWGTAELNSDRLFHHLLELFNSFYLPVSLARMDPATSAAYLDADPANRFFRPRIRYSIKIPFYYINIDGTDRELGIEILDLPKVDDKLPGILIQPNIPSEIGSSLRLREDVYLNIVASSNINQVFGLVIRPGGISVKYPFQNGDTLPEEGFGAGIDYSPADPKLILGSEENTRIQFQGIAFDFTAHLTGADPELILGFNFKNLALILQSSESDGFIKSILGDSQTKIDIPLGLEWSNKSGIHFKGGGGFEVALSPHMAIGPITIDEFLIRLTGGSDPHPNIKLNAGASIAGDLGPVQFVVSNIGLSVQAIFVKGGNTGPFDFSIGFKPPDGIGLSIDTGIIKGGGFLSFDTAKSEYTGALELTFSETISLKAIGILTTKMPDSSSGFSLLIIITAEFTPLQLGFGFTLNGVGGLLGLNRTVKTDTLREGIKTNTLQSILFPQDIIANINRIVSDIKQVFPPLQDHFLVGPMAELGWGTPPIITLEIGLVLEIPSPRILILGIIKALLPDENTALLRIQVNFLGIIDFQNKCISFDAFLYDSRLLTFTITGQMAFRLSWGDNPMFIISVGGFHPAFHEAPRDLQNMQRITISLLNVSNAHITVQTYFAVTSNTVQFGARAELYASAGGFNVYGFIGYDVLFQFDPFRFIADFAAGLALRRGNSVIMGINVSGELEGPSPWHARGSASIDFFFFSISVSFNETWGESSPHVEPQKIDILALLRNEVNDNRNWKAEIPNSNHLHVSVKKIELTADNIVIHPMGVLTFSERLAPLDISINKFGNKIPLDANRFEIISSDTDVTTDKVKEQFAPANFFEKTDHEKLSDASFVLLNSGFKVTASSDLTMPRGKDKSVDY